MLRCQPFGSLWQPWEPLVPRHDSRGRKTRLQTVAIKVATGLEPNGYLFWGLGLHCDPNDARMLDVFVFWSFWTCDSYSRKVEKCRSQIFWMILCPTWNWMHTSDRDHKEQLYFFTIGVAYCSNDFCLHALIWWTNFTLLREPRGCFRQTLQSCHCRTSCYSEQRPYRT